MRPFAPVLQAGLVPPEALPLLLIIAGLGLSVAEALAPGAHLIVVGVALLLAGVVGLVLGPLASPFVLALLVVVFGSLALYGYREFDIYGGKGEARTSDSDSLRGKFGRVTERVTPTAGEIKLESGGFNPHYSARSVDGEIPVGTEVMVIDPGGGNVVTVEALDEFEDEIDRELARGRDAAAERERDSSSDAASNRGTEMDETEPEADETELETDTER